LVSQSDFTEEIGDDRRLADRSRRRHRKTRFANGPLSSSYTITRAEFWLIESVLGFTNRL
jgi:hypothetical protein